jgi:SAM-dependent methyltransferase
MSSTDKLYENYVAFKGWDANPGGENCEDYAALVALVDLNGPLNILEIGFGAGAFLDWARAAGHRVVGIDILPDMVAAVRARGHEAYLPSESRGVLRDGEFNLVMAIDVVEHLDEADLAGLMADARRVLKPGGRLVARFPNGESPFFGRFQHGDHTHKRPLTAMSLEQRVLPMGMRLERAVNPRALPQGLGRRFKRQAAYLMRDAIEILIGYAYFGRRLPIDPNIAVVLSPIPDVPVQLSKVQA